ncbi:hypothetical protein S7335_935 [Synechococcus sp. PCC 7335]|uniref:hypothetical protein n=1 Tax=Synechococcus sp. (strain ATCC 29403 / PCC 7335) TaxID=91464 RepID=UPI00017ECF23|nr:hypothetical protein [Synechococcus sp. PCC 7335]EDX82634.1 hypothetical protein S7335_935 [Synechococcus sp. PCC 7335]
MLLFDRQVKYRSYLVACFYAGLILFVSASAVFAQDAPGGPTSILDNALEVSIKSEEGLNELWKTTFTNGYSPGYDAIIDFARKIAVIPFFWLFIPITRDFVSNRYEEMFKHVAWLVLILMLSANDFGLITTISHGSRNFINASTREILSFQLGPVTMQDALTDVLITEEAKATIQANLAECEAKEGEEQKKCYVDGAEEAKESLEEIRNDKRFLGIRFARLESLIKRLDRVIKDIDITANNGMNDMTFGLLNFAFQTTGQAITQQLMKGFQSAMMTIIDVGFYLTALLAPVAVVSSLAPLQPRVLFIWGAGYVGFALMKMSYNILIGAIAAVASLIQATDFGSTGLLISMGVLSPILAMGMGSWAGTRLVHAMAGGATAMVSMIPVPVPRR